MTPYFAHTARALLGNGYLIIPIKAGEKRPVMNEWQSARLGAGDIGRYSQPGIGAGVLCGQGATPLAAIDIDTTNAALAEDFTAWCRENLGYGCERIGNAPKILLAYRAAAPGWGKATGAWLVDEDGERHRLEVLGKGQQFVAYHTHPLTKRPYEWTDFHGGLANLDARELPVLDEAQIAQALDVFETMATRHGLKRAPNSRTRSGAHTGGSAVDPLMAFEPAVGIDLDEAARLLRCVCNEDYDTWLKAGMSLHHEFEGSESALEVWNDWSSSASNYVGFDDLANRWEGFGVSEAAPVTVRWLMNVAREGQRESQRAERREALEQAKARISACDDSIALVGEVAPAVGAAADDDLAVRAELAGLIRARFKALTDTTLPVADVRAAMAGGKRPTPASKTKRVTTEFGNAERMLDHYGAGLRYVPELDAWFSWTGVYWQRVPLVHLEHLAKETVRALPDEGKAIDSDGERADFYKFCGLSQRVMMVRNMVSLAQSDPRVVVSVDELDRNPNLFGVANGAVDLFTGDLLAPDMNHLITTVAAVDYDPTAAAPLFEETLLDVFSGDADMVDFFARLIGYTLMGDPKEDVLVIPYGGGANGKSTVLGAIRDALGAHAKIANAETFLTSGHGSAAGGAREDVLRLRGARFVYVTEPEENSELREGLIKSMTGGEAMPARGLYSRITVQVPPTWVALMPTNHRPIVKGDDHAIWRRLLPVPFLRNFDAPGETNDKARAAKLALELPGILRWCVAGALAYQREGLTAPASVHKAHEDYRADMDLLGDWLNECCETGAEYFEGSARLWASWERYAGSRGELRFISSTKNLIRRLLSRGFEPVRTRKARGLRGLRVRSIDELL